MHSLLNMDGHSLYIAMSGTLILLLYLAFVVIISNYYDAIMMLYFIPYSLDYHSLSLKRDMSPSMNSLNTVSSSSLGSMSLERRGSMSKLPTALDPDSLSQSHEISVQILDEAQKVKKLHHGSMRAELPVSHSFDHGRISGSVEPAPPLPPRNMIKKRAQTSEPTIKSPGTM